MAKRKTAFITGAGEGVGKAIAIRLAKDGYNIAINDTREDLAQKAANEIIALGSNCIVLVGDVSDEEATKNMFNTLKKKYKRLDVMVNNMETYSVNTFEDASATSLKNAFKTNAIPVMVCSQLSAAIMKKQKTGGKIISSAGQSSFGENPDTFDYATISWGIRGMTRAMAASLAKSNIKVNTYCLGAVSTEEQESVEFDGYYDVSSIPLGRFQTVDDVAELVSYLASSEADNITGQNILLNGGQIMN